MVEIRGKLESVTRIVKDFGIEWDFLVGFKMRRSGRDEDIDAGFLLFQVSGFVRCRGLLEKEFEVFCCEVSQSLV